MFEILLLLLVAVSNLRSATSCVAMYGQCGGINYNGATDCCSPSTCQYGNDYYSQCLPGTTTKAPTGATKAPSQDCGATYAQCGGIGWTGSTTCCTGSTCNFQNDYYSQCLPTSGVSAASTTTMKPATTTMKPATTTMKPATTTVKAATTTVKPATTTVKPATTTVKPATTTMKPSTTPVLNDDRQDGVTTRYWDCCKPSCGWSGKASVTSPVKTCAQNGIIPVDINAQSGCNGGTGYMCNNQQPWNVSSTLSYGYAAAVLSGQTESDWCCACYSLLFTSVPLVGKELIVQVTNTGGDLGANHFDLQMPGGGVGIFDGCSSQFPQVSKSSWGQQYGGVSQRSDCDKLPSVLQSGCRWRFDWFMNADNPNMRLKKVTCPAALTVNTGCVRN